jgi:two-component system sensor histidine kinase VicK
MESQSTMPVFPALEEVAILSSEAIFIVDLQERKITFTNPSAITFLGLQAGDPLSRLESLMKKIHVEDREYVGKKYLIVAKQPTTTNFEFRFLQRGDVMVWLDCKTYLFHKNRFVLVVVADVTEMRHHEEYLVEFGTKKNTVLDTVAHQLNGALSLMANLAVKAGKLNMETDRPAIDKFISLVYDNSNHCIKIITELLSEEHRGSPGVPTKFSRVDVVKMIRYIFEELKRSQPTRNLIFDSDSPTFFLDTDEFRLLQVVNNLASNALKFTQESDEIRFILRQYEKTFMIAVADSGIGIPDDLQPFLFEKRGPARRTGLNGEKSIGLGLSICKNLTTLLKGRMWIESSEGAGTTVFIELPKELDLPG